MRRENILVVTQWGYEEGLIQSYTLPYLKIIHKVNPSKKIYLITQEKGETGNERITRAREELRNYNIVLLPEKYHRAGLAKYFSTVFNFLKHLWIILSKNIRYIHTFCTPAGS